MPKVDRAINSVLNNKARDALGRISNPRTRDAAGRLVNALGNAIFPGFGGSIQDYSDNIFVQQQRLQQQTGIAGTVEVLDGDTESQIFNTKYDWRARLRPKNGGASRIYALDERGEGLLGPLKEAGGMIWQTTPQIFLSGSANYNEQLMQGMNYSIFTYLNSQQITLPVSAEFYANDIYEGRYLLAVMHFLRVITKAHFGDSSVAKGTFGTPPPVLLFEYLGDHGFNKVPVIVKDWTYSLPNDVDYVPVVTTVNGAKQTTFVPTRTEITVNLAPSYTPHKIRKQFDLDSLTNGRGYRDGFV